MATVDERKEPTPSSTETPSKAALGDLNECFKSFPLSLFELPPGGHVVVIPSDASISEAVATLSKHNILAAPVRDVTCTAPNPQWHELFLGLFSMTDAVFAALRLEEIATGGEAPAEGATTTDDVSPKSLFKFLATRRFFTETSVTEALHTFKFGPFVPLEEDDTTSLLDAALILGKYRQHRVVVIQPSTGPRSEEALADIVSPDRRLRNIITQSAIIKLLCRESFAKKLHPITSKTLAELGLGSSSAGVVSVTLDERTLTAFTRMADEGVSAVAVLGREGELIGCVSNRDARVIATARHSLEILHSPVRTLLRMAHDESTNITSPSIHAQLTDSLELVMQRMAVARIHRVFIVDDDFRPTGVVSLSDVLTTLVKEPTPDYFGDYFDNTVPA